MLHFNFILQTEFSLKAHRYKAEHKEAKEEVGEKSWENTRLEINPRRGQERKDIYDTEILMKGMRKDSNEVSNYLIKTSSIYT